jgi:tRNA (guanine10-N2)-methyltransferase
MSWCICLEAFGRSYDRQQQEEKRSQFQQCLPFNGPVKLKNPQSRFWIIEDVGVPEELKAQVAGAEGMTEEELRGAAKLLPPRAVYFTREVRGCGRGMGHRGGRDLVDRQTLKKRTYLGPTAMNAGTVVV